MRDVRIFMITRSGIIAAILLFMGISYSVLWSSSAAAAKPLAQIDLNLPTGKLLKPVTDLTNPITSRLPVSANIQSEPDKIGVTAGLPILTSAQMPNQESASLLDLNVPLPGLSQTLDSPIQTVNRTVNSLLPQRIGTPQQPQTPITAPSSSSQDTNNPPKSATVAQKPPRESTNKTSSRQDNSPLAEVVGFFSSALPNALRSFASGLIDKPTALLPMIVSVLILLLTMGAVGGIIHASNHGGVLSLGRMGSINLVRIAQNNNIAQITTLVVATIGFGVVATFLTLTVL